MAVGIPALLLAWLLWWVYASKRRERRLRDSAVAAGNHPSLRKFHYGPAPAPAPGPLVAAPPLAPDSPLNQLLPEEDFKAREEQETAAEAVRVEARQMAAREAAQVPAPVGAATEEPGPALVDEPAGVPADVPANELITTPADGPVPELSSSRHAPGATVNVLDVLTLVGNDSPQSVGALPALDDGRVPETIYDNPLTETPRTKNDVANRAAAVELRKRKRAAFQAGTDGQKAALTALMTENDAPH